MKRGRFWLASGLLWLLGGSGVACLLPQDDWPPLPPRMNRPPRIIRADPDRFKTVQLGGCDGDKVTFQAWIEDPDEDKLRVRFYVDSNINPEPVSRFSLCSKKERLGCQALESARFEANLTLGAGLAVEGHHVLEVLVADNDYDEPSRNVTHKEIVLPDGGTALDYYYSDSYVWIIDTRQCRTP